MNMTWLRACLLAATVLGTGAPVVLHAQRAGENATSGTDRASEDSLLVQKERGQWEALKARDTTAFARLMGDGVVDVDVSGARRTSPASTARYVLGCETTSYRLTDLRIVHVGDAAIVTYTANIAATCWGQKAPSPLYVMTVYARRGANWMPIAHSETPASRR
jgi:ketosteroid isomerase-like protein